MNKLRIRISGVFVIAFFLWFLNGNAQNRQPEYKFWQGTRFIHPVEDKLDSLSSQEIIELRGDNGLPLWFVREIHKVVCLTGECRMVHLRIYWDGSGNYLAIEPEANEPLTKTDHHDFNSDDYRKLNGILSDSTSVLKNLKQDELILLPDKKMEKTKADAYTGATRQSLQEYLVKNAAYTCYTLWHTVYGPTRSQILSMLDARIDTAYLKKIFELNDPAYLVRAIQFVNGHPAMQPIFEDAILKQVRSENSEIAHHALAYFTLEKLKDQKIQAELAEAVGLALSQIKFEVTWKFSKLPAVTDQALLILLEQYERNRIYAGLLGYVFEMIHSENLKNPRITKAIKKLSRDKNPYVKDLAKNILSHSRK